MRLRLLAFLLLLASPATATDYAALNAAAVERHVLPGYAALAAATARLDAAARASCADAPALQAAWRGAMRAWQGVQHLRFGPVELFQRHPRFEFWPDPRNVAGRQLAELFARRVPEAIAPHSFAVGSVAVQGLGAMERALFEPAQAKALAEDAYRCAWLRAAAANVAAMAREVEAEWRGPPRDFARTFSSAAPGGAYADAREATLDLFKSLHAAVELVADHKLARPLGDKPEAPRPRLAESWRSGASLDNAAANLEAARGLYDALAAGVSDKALDAELRLSFAEAIAAAAAIGRPLEEAVVERRDRANVVRLQRATAQLKDLLADRLGKALDLPLGFNALDGD